MYSLYINEKFKFKSQKIDEVMIIAENFMEELISPYYENDDDLIVKLTRDKKNAYDKLKSEYKCDFHKVMFEIREDGISESLFKKIKKTALKESLGINYTREYYEKILGKSNLDGLLYLIHLADKENGWTITAQDYSEDEQNEFIEDCQCIDILVEMTDDNDSTYTRFYNAYDALRNNNISPDDKISDVIWSYVKGEII